MLRIIELNVFLINLWLDNRNLGKTLNPVNGDFDITDIDENAVSDYADSILKGKYRIFGRIYDFNNNIPWNTDFESGFIWGKGTLFRKYIQVDLNNKADVKYPRELSRFHHILFLGQAYQVSKDKQYYHKFQADILDWINENPFMKSINWGCTQDVAIRAVNWIWGMYFFRHELAQDRHFKHKMETSLYKHGFYIFLYPEKAPFNNHNHYISDLVGQIYLGLYFKSDKKAAVWLKTGIEELYREIRYQILPSGPSYERSINYHRFVTEMLLSAITLIRNNGYEIPRDILHRLEMMLEFVLYYTKPDGIAPNIGDQDDARLYPFSIMSNLDHRYLLCIGAVLFNRGDFKKWSGRFYSDCSAMLGSGARAEYNQIPTGDAQAGSKAFPDAGFYIIRDHDNYMFINNSGKSKNSELGGGTHTHSDLLSFELYMGNKTFLVDPGSYQYSGDPDMRMLFRSTKMHNTLEIDGQNQNTLSRENLWDFSRDALPKTLHWSVDKDKVIFEGEHTGYLKLTKPAMHKRHIEYSNKDKSFLIIDTIRSESNHKVKLYFHFDIGINPVIEGNSVKTVCEDGLNIELRFTCDYPVIIDCREDLVSKVYGTAVSAKTIIVETNSLGSCNIETKIQRTNS